MSEMSSVFSSEDGGAVGLGPPSLLLSLPAAADKEALPVRESSLPMPKAHLSGLLVLTSAGAGLGELK